MTEEEYKKLRELEASLRVQSSGLAKIASKQTGEYRHKFVGKDRIHRSGVHPVYAPKESK